MTKDVDSMASEMGDWDKPATLADEKLRAESGGCHPSHVTRSSDASTFDEICTFCGAKDISGGGWGKLSEPCPAALSQPAPVVERATAREDDAFDVKLTMLGDGRFYDEHQGEWEMTRETYEKRTADCQCSHCVERRASTTVAPESQNAEASLREELKNAIAAVEETAGVWESTASSAGQDMISVAMDLVEAARVFTIAPALATAPAVPDGRTEEVITPAMINAAAEAIWNDRDARMGGPWVLRSKDEVCVIQTRATAKAAIAAALSERRT